MELIDKVKRILGDTKLTKPIIDIHYDEQKNIVGFVCSNSFDTMTVKSGQNIIWEALRNNLPGEDLLRILAIFHETPTERSERLGSHKRNETKRSFNYLWLHESPDNTKYWVLIDVAKLGDDFNTFYIIVCAKEKIKKGAKLKYTKEVLDFMELRDDEIFDELFSNIWGNAVAELKSILIKKYDQWEKKDSATRNPYRYVFEDFSTKFKPILMRKAIFINEEIKLFEKVIPEIGSNFTAIKELYQQISISQKFKNPI